MALQAFAGSKLAEEGRATKLSGNGYPNRYTARVGDVLPLLEQVKPTRRHSNIELEQSNPASSQGRRSRAGHGEHFVRVRALVDAYDFDQALQELRSVCPGNKGA